MKRSNSYFGDVCLSITVCIQSLLIVLQQCMVGIFHMEPESTTIYRVFFSAIPVIMSFYFILKRDALFAVGTYIIVLSIMLFHSVIFPDNEPYIWKEGTRFLLPICIPTMLAMRIVNTYDVFDKVLTVVSWSTIFLLFIYVISFFAGLVSIENYNMSFGYGLLLPTLVLYRQQTLFSKIVFLFASLSILLLGSRGPLLVIFAFIIYDVFCNNKRYIPVVLGMFTLFVVSIPFLIDYLDNIGISSRTLNLFINGELSQDSGRGYLSNITFRSILEHPFWGLGIFGDRVLLEGIQPYCHNLFMELFVNWGIPFSIIFLFLFFRRIIKTYFFIKNKQQRILLVLFLFSSIIPLMLSASYLIDPIIWSFFGLLLFYKRNAYRVV